MSDSSEKSLFLNAIEIDSQQEREQYLQTACGGDHDLLRAVSDLLSAHEKEQNPLDHPVAVAEEKLTEIEAGKDASGPLQPSGMDATVDQPAGPQGDDVGRQIGPYRLMEKIGEGGFGLVYVAQQDRPVRRKVALKIVKPGTGSGEVLARFDAERQAVAMMDHPNIAKVFDAGQTADGRPYFVMELVRGMPITQFCKQQGLGLTDRLSIFEDVCAATHHAHQKGVIHRDLKPSNVLVTLHDTKAVAKVIDFGVAKAIGQNLTDKTIYTRLFSMVGTPLYMSPEQASMSGLDVDIRSDIYSLGVLLYELLTGTTPFDRDRLDTVGYDEMRRIIREEEPPKPSTRQTTIDRNQLDTLGQPQPPRTNAMERTGKRLDPIPSDLDWIVMTALDKDRTRRYESAAAMAADVRRFLSQEPIQARPPSRAYLISKFARKHVVALATSAIVVSALVVGLAMSLYQASWAIHERNEKTIALQDAIVAKNEANQARLEVENFAQRLKNANSLLGEARSYEQSGQEALALAAYSEAVDLVPNYYLVWISRAQLYLQQQKWHLAAADFEQALSLDAPVHSSEWQGVPALFAMVGKAESFDIICQRLLAPAVNDPSAIHWGTIRSCVVVPSRHVDYQLMANRAEELLQQSPPRGPHDFGRRGEHRSAEMPGNRATDNRGRPPRSDLFFGPGTPQPRDAGRFDSPEKPFAGPPLGPPNRSGPPDRSKPDFPNGPDRRSREHFLPHNVKQYLTGLANLRAGNHARAIELLNASGQGGKWHADYVTYAPIAIAHYRSANLESARAMLDKSNSVLRDADDSATQQQGYWVDLVEGIVLNREANQLFSN